METRAEAPSPSPTAAGAAARRSAASSASSSTRGRRRFVSFTDIAETLASAADPRTLAARGIGPLRHRDSPGIPGGYISNGCWSCDALIGRLGLEDMLDEHLRNGGTYASSTAASRSSSSCRPSPPCSASPSASDLDVRAEDDRLVVGQAEERDGVGGVARDGDEEPLAPPRHARVVGPTIVMRERK